MNNTINNYSLASENELADILSHYSSEFVISIVNDAIEQCCNNPNGIQFPNAVKMWEVNFNSIMEDYGEEADQVKQVRISTYNEIIGIICNAYNLNFTIDDSVDIYSAAYNLYSFFISNLSSNIISFFSSYIYNNRQDLYESLDISDAKKQRDIASAYTRRNVGGDEALICVIMNIDMVVRNIMGMDIGFDEILQTIFPNNYDIAYFISSIVSPKDGEFFNRFCMHLNGDTRPMMLTMIRFALQNLYIGSLNSRADHLEEIVDK